MRAKTLDIAKDIIGGDRKKAYGDPNVMFGKIAALWAAYLDVDVSAVDAATMMALMKIARAQKGRYDIDSYIDNCGYMALASEMRMDIEKATTLLPQGQGTDGSE